MTPTPSSTPHTVGEWTFMDSAVRLKDKPDHVICEVISWSCRSLGETFANGDLIAAAPDLMKALKSLLSFYVIDGEFSTVPCMGPKDKEIEAAWGAAQAALTKATVRGA